MTPPAHRAAYDQVQELLARVDVAVAVATSRARCERTDRRSAVTFRRPAVRAADDVPVKAPFCDAAVT